MVFSYLLLAFCGFISIYQIGALLNDDKHRVECYMLPNAKPPTYLWKHFTMFSYLFPGRITINATFSQLQGLLLHAKDHQGQSLILSMHTNTEANFNYGKSRSKIHLSKLCLCHNECRYELLLLDITVTRTTAVLQCNAGVKHILNRIIISNATATATTPKLWLLNSPEQQDLMQVTGCLFSVSHNGQPIKMNVKGSGYQLARCNRTCVYSDVNHGPMCNDGKCIETYNVGPSFCNCDFSFNNGEYCNKEPITGRGVWIYRKSFKFEMLKVAWKSKLSSKILFQLQSKSLHLEFYVSNSNKLSLNIADRNNSRQQIDDIFKKYQHDKNTVMIVTCMDRYLSIEVSQQISSTNYTSAHKKVSVINNIANIHFHQLNSHTEQFAALIKEYRRYITWKNLSGIYNNTYIKKDVNSSTTVVIVVVIILLVVVLVTIITLYIYCKSKKNSKHSRTDNYSSSNNHSRKTTEILLRDVSTAKPNQKLKMTINENDTNLYNDEPDKMTDNEASETLKRLSTATSRSQINNVDVSEPLEKEDNEVSNVEKRYSSSGSFSSSSQNFHSMQPVELKMAINENGTNLDYDEPDKITDNEASETLKRLPTATSRSQINNVDVSEPLEKEDNEVSNVEKRYSSSGSSSSSSQRFYSIQPFNDY